MSDWRDPVAWFLAVLTAGVVSLIIMLNASFWAEWYNGKVASRPCVVETTKGP